MNIIGGVIFSIIISICLPLLFFCYSLLKKYHTAFILGAIAFIISQVLIRIPVLDYLQIHSTSFIFLSATHPILFSLIIGFSAGIVEELARFIMMRFFLKKHNWRTGFMFGAGHGGIEAVLFLGIAAIYVLFSPPTNLYNSEFFIGGVERLFAMVLHIGLSIIVLQGVTQNRFFYVVIAIAIHGFIDSLIGIIPLFTSPKIAIISIEFSLILTAIVVFGYSLSIRRKDVL